jgi:hypothetical protein
VFFFFGLGGAGARARENGEERVRLRTIKQIPVRPRGVWWCVL